MAGEKMAIAKTEAEEPPSATRLYRERQAARQALFRSDLTDAELRSELKARGLQDALRERDSLLLKLMRAPGTTRDELLDATCKRSEDAQIMAIQKALASRPHEKERVWEMDEEIREIEERFGLQTADS